MTVSKYPDDGVGEVFLKLGKQGSTLAGVMDAFSMAISISLQYGVPLEKWVEKFTNMRFEPAGVTDDPDIRIASSVMDYVFRRLALDHLPYETRSELGILSASERAAQLAGEDPGAVAAEDMDPAEMAQSAPRERQPEPARQEQAASQAGWPRLPASGQAVNAARGSRSRRPAPSPTSRTARPSCSSRTRDAPRTRRCASSAAPRCAPPEAATSAKAAAPPAAAARNERYCN